MSNKLRRMLYGLLIEVVDTVLPALVIAVLITLFVAQGTYVYGQSMEPNLHQDQRLIVEKISYRLRGPRRGDIVVVLVEGHDVPPIKRVIGLPNETIAMMDFGIMGHLDQLQRLGLVNLFVGLLRGETDRVVEALSDLGIATKAADRRNLKVLIKVNPR